MVGGPAPRSQLSWLAIVSRLGAAVLAAMALSAEGESPRWVLLACAGGLALLPLAWRRKAAVAPGAIFAASADYLPGGWRGSRFPGQLSMTANALSWSPSGYSIAKEFRPLMLAIDDCAAIGWNAGPALLDVTVKVRWRDGHEWVFVTHRRRGLRRAIEGMNDLTSQ